MKKTHEHDVAADWPMAKNGAPTPSRFFKDQRAPIGAPKRRRPWTVSANHEEALHPLPWESGLIGPPLFHIKGYGLKTWREKARELGTDGLPSRVLFACNQNSVLSPMAACIMTHYHGHRISADSVGVRAGKPVGFLVQTMDECGIDMRRHISRTFTDVEDKSYDLVISLSPEAQHSAVELTRTTACAVEYWPTFDPSVLSGAGQVMGAAYRQLRGDLVRRILEQFPRQTLGAPLTQPKGRSLERSGL